MYPKFLEGRESLESLKESVIYFLFQGEKIVYVGKSIYGKTRIIQHLKESERKKNYYSLPKRFDSYYMMPCVEEMLDVTEKAFISYFRPKYNKALPSNDEISREIYREILNNEALKG